MDNVSLLFCEEDSIGIPIMDAVFQDLNLDQIITEIQNNDSFYRIGAMYRRFPVTKREEQYRRNIFQAFKAQGAEEALHQFSEEMKEVHRAEEKRDDIPNELQKRAWHLYAACHYCRAIKQLERLLSTGPAAHTDGLRETGQYLETYTKSEWYLTFCAVVEELYTIFFDHPIVLSVQNQKIYVDWEETQQQYDCTLRNYFSEQRQPCKSPFLGDAQMYELEREIFSILEKKYPKHFRKLGRFFQDYPEFLDQRLVQLEEEVQFYRLFLKFQREMEAYGFSFCVPSEEETRDMEARGLYDLALALQHRHDRNRIVVNDIRYKDEEMFFVVNGPNQGGKTTFSRSIGQLVYFTKMGLDVPALEANVHFYQTLMTHFSVEESALTGRGKLKEELERLEPMMKSSSEASFIILNELFTTAANYDARIMGKRVLEYFMSRGCRGVYVTHLEDLTHFSEHVVAMSATLLAGGHQRTYKIERGNIQPYGYASDLVEKHGLTYQQLKERLKGERG